MKFILKSLFALLFISPLLAEEIKIYTWDNFTSPSLIEEFTKKTGHTVKLYFFDNEIERNAVLMNSEGNKYDLVMVDNLTTKRYGDLGMLQPLSSSEIDNLQHNSQQSRNACGQYGVPYAQGTIGIIHRKSISKTPIDSWTHLLKPPKEHVGTTMMLKDVVETTAIALLAQGDDPFTHDRDELKSAYAVLTKQSKYLLKYGYPITYTKQKGQRSQLTLAAVYSGDLYNIKQITGQNDWQYVVPKEGTLFYIDCLTSPAEKPLSEASKAFLSFINEPTNAYKNASDIWFSTTNEAALSIASEQYKNDSEISPNVNILKRSYPYKQLNKQDLMIRNRMVALLKTNK